MICKAGGIQLHRCNQFHCMTVAMQGVWRVVTWWVWRGEDCKRYAGCPSAEEPTPRFQPLSYLAPLHGETVAVQCLASAGAKFCIDEGWVGFSRDSTQQSPAFRTRSNSDGMEEASHGLAFSLRSDDRRFSSRIRSALRHEQTGGEFHVCAFADHGDERWK